MNAKLAEEEEDSFAGLWIQHIPQFQIIVQFTHDGAKTIQPYIKAGPLANIVEVRPAKVALRELERERAAAVFVAGELDIRENSGINVFENRAELYVLDQEQLDVALQKTTTQLPAHVEVVEVDKLAKQSAAIFGGKALDDCTSGFSVQYYGTKGITTAGHCLNVQHYNGSTLPYQWGTPGGVYDIQWNRAPGFTVRNLIWDGTYNRYIYSTKPEPPIGFQKIDYEGEEHVILYSPGRPAGYTIDGNVASTCHDTIHCNSLWRSLYCDTRTYEINSFDLWRTGHGRRLPSRERKN